MKSSLLFLLLILPSIAFAGLVERDNKIEIEIDIKGNPAQIARLSGLSSKLSDVINSKEFRERISKASFSYTTDSGKQVLQKLIDGAEIGTQKDNTWQLSYVFEEKERKCFGIGRFKKCSKWVLGWTSPSIKEVYINSLTWDSRQDCAIVGTLVHEQTHKLGYSHPFKSTKRRPASVPYAAGSVATQVCNKK